MRSRISASWSCTDGRGDGLVVAPRLDAQRAQQRRRRARPGHRASPSTGCSPWSARWWKTRLTTVHGLNVSCSRHPRSLEPRAPPRSSHVTAGCRKVRRLARFARPPTTPAGAGRTMPDVSSARAERLVNLVLCLLSTRQFLTAERIRHDRARLRRRAERRGVLPDVRAGQDRAARAGRPAGDRAALDFDTVDGYRIARQDYELGEIDLESDEAAAVALAARLWESPELAEPAHGALVKLRAAGVEVDEDQGRVAAAGAAPPSPRSRRCWPRCRPGARSRSTTGGAARRARSRGARWSRGAWCPGGAAGTWSATTATGTAPRSFRVSRISRAGHRRSAAPARCTVPAGVDLMAMVAARRGARRRSIGTARVWVADGRAHGLRRLGGSLGRRDHAGRPGDELELELRSLDTVARWLAGPRPGRRRAAPARARRARCGRTGRPPRRRTPAPRRGDGVNPPDGSARRVRSRRAVPQRRERAGSPSACRGCCRSCPTCSPAPGIPVAEAAADFGIRERQLRRDLELLWMCGLPGYGPGDLVDLSFSGRHRHRHRGRRDAPPAAADHGGGHRAAGRAAHAGRRARAWPTPPRCGGPPRRSSARWATPGAAGAVAATRSAAEEAATTADGARGAGRRAGRCGSATTPRAATPSRSARSTRCGCSSSTAAATWRPGAGAPRRCGCSGWTGWSDVVVLDEPAAPPPDAEPTDVSAGLFRPARRAPLGRAAAGARGALGGRVLPGGRGRRARATSRVRVLLRYADPDWLVRLVLGLGGGARLLEPPELVEAVGASGRAQALGRGRRRSTRMRRHGAGDADGRSGGVGLLLLVLLVLVMAVLAARRFARASAAAAARRRARPADAPACAPPVGASRRPLAAAVEPLRRRPPRLATSA